MGLATTAVAVPKPLAVICPSSEIKLQLLELLVINTAG